MEQIITRDQHIISRSNISENALKVLYRLKEYGYAAYLVGGSVRDLLLGLNPKDFDIATDAWPDQIERIFRNCRLIGRRFRLAHIHFSNEIIEVATFRGTGDDAVGEHYMDETGMIVRDNAYGSLAQDALRRDFTINSLYYNIADFSVVDFTDSLKDIEQGIVRLIGDPVKRYHEDPVRMLRAIRFCAKLNMRLHPDTEAPLFQLQALLNAVPGSRLFEEILKLFHCGFACQVFEQLRYYDLFQHLFPATNHCLKQTPQNNVTLAFIEQALSSTDQRIHAGKHVSPAFLLSVLLWQPMLNLADQLMDEGVSPQQARDNAMARVIQNMPVVRIPRRLVASIYDIWKLQRRLYKRRGNYAWQLLTLGRFRAGYDFLVLRANASNDPELQALAQWWTDFQAADEATRNTMVQSLSDHSPPPKPRRKSKKFSRQHRTHKKKDSKK